jgi:transposase
MNIQEEKLRDKFEIVRLYKEGNSIRTIAEKTSVPKSTAHYIVQKYNEANTVMRIKGSGRKNLLT